MLFAKVVFGIPVEGPFDYIVPANLSEKIKVGERARVSFRNLELSGYVVKLTRESEIKNLKTIQELIDDSPILGKNMLSLTKELSDYYCCSWGEAIDTATRVDLSLEDAHTSRIACVSALTSEPLTAARA